jgi:hypothetical protein
VSRPSGFPSKTLNVIHIMANVRKHKLTHRSTHTHTFFVVVVVVVVVVSSSSISIIISSSSSSRTRRRRSSNGLMPLLSC